MTLVDLVGYCGVGVNIVAYSMRSMIPLRIAAIGTNILFLIYSGVVGVYPTLFLNAVLLPLNVYRLVEMLRLIRDVTEAAKGSLSLDWLKPFTETRDYKSSDVVFRRGDEATYLAFVVRGEFRISEFNIVLRDGAVLGELGLLSPGNRRTQSLECISAGRLLVISYKDVRQLQVQAPLFGVYLLQIVGSRMFQNIQRLQAEIAQLRAT
jgi:CRP/FNR family cyclic AMP-dependent transcriptional regulator